MIDDFDMGIVFKFANDYFNNVFIIKFIDLTKSNLSCEFNNLSNRQAVICLKKTDKKYYKIVSFIYDYRLIKIDNDELEFYDNISLVEDNDYLVIIGFESINKKLISLLNKVYIYI